MTVTAAHLSTFISSHPDRTLDDWATQLAVTTTLADADTLTGADAATVISQLLACEALAAEKRLALVANLDFDGIDVETLPSAATSLIPDLVQKELLSDDSKAFSKVSASGDADAVRRLVDVTKHLPDYLDDIEPTALDLNVISHASRPAIQRALLAHATALTAVTNPEDWTKLAHDKDYEVSEGSLIALASQSPGYIKLLTKNLPDLGTPTIQKILAAMGEPYSEIGVSQADLPLDTPADFITALKAMGLISRHRTLPKNGGIRVYPPT